MKKITIMNFVIWIVTLISFLFIASKTVNAGTGCGVCYSGNAGDCCGVGLRKKATRELGGICANTNYVECCDYGSGCPPPPPPPPSTPTPTPQRICTPLQTQCVDTSVCSSKCRACSGDGTYWYCTDSSYCNWCLSSTPTRTPTPTPTRTPTPTPTLYPTVAISGNLQEYLGDNGCYQGIYSSFISIQINPQSPQGITPTCAITPPSGDRRLSYRCTLTLDNQNAQPTPAQQVNLAVANNSYSSAYWTDNNQCSSIANNSLTFNVASSPPTNVFAKDIFFKADDPWIKLKNTSFNKYQGDLNNPISYQITPYDGDDNNQRYFIIENAGVVSASSINLRSTDVSLNNYQQTSYPPIKRFNLGDFLTYVYSRKNHQSIDNLNQILEDKIYVFLKPNTSITIDDSNKSSFDDKKIVIFVNGNVNINSDDPFNNDSSVAIIATDTINFSSLVTYAKGIFIANTIDSGSTSNQGLKIKGNLIAFNQFSNNRRWQDNRKPSVFIVFDPSIYLNLLDKLSIAKYDWQQTQ